MTKDIIIGKFSAHRFDNSERFEPGFSEMFYDWWLYFDGTKFLSVSNKPPQHIMDALEFLNDAFELKESNG